MRTILALRWEYGYLHIHIISQRPQDLSRRSQRTYALWKVGKIVGKGEVEKEFSVSNIFRSPVECTTLVNWKERVLFPRRHDDARGVC